MGCVRVLEGETPAMLSARLNRPICMILRANRLYSVAWLLPGREICVPDETFCRYDGFCCPACAMRQRAAEERTYAVPSALDTVRALAARLRLPERVVLLAAGRSSGELPSGTRLTLWFDECAGIVHVGPGDTMSALCARLRLDEACIRRLNRLWGPLLPGMRLLLPKGYGEGDKRNEGNVANVCG